MPNHRNRIRRGNGIPRRVRQRSNNLPVSRQNGRGVRPAPVNTSSSGRLPKRARPSRSLIGNRQRANRGGTQLGQNNRLTNTANGRNNMNMENIIWSANRAWQCTGSTITPDCQDVTTKLNIIQ